MSPNPPEAIRKFYDKINSLDADSLRHHPAYVEPRKLLREQSSKIMQRSVARRRALAHHYEAVQLACFDYLGQCGFCGDGSFRHAHSVQPSSVYEIEGFRGLYIYPEFLRDVDSRNRLTDQLLHEELASPDNRTNLHDDYHVTYPSASGRDGSPISFFEPEGSQLKMQPRLDDSWVSFPIGVTHFVENLRWINMPLPANIKRLVEDILQLQLEVKSATAHISSSADKFALRQDEQRSGSFVNLSLGCDGIIVVGKECQPDTTENLKLPSTQKEVPDENLRQSVVGLEDENIGKGNKSQDKDEIIHNGGEQSNYHLAAIRLSHGDALLFEGEGLDIWHGVAKVIEGSAKDWEQDWPCWDVEASDSRMQDWKGCMKGRRIDLFTR